jgi:hypothetical protein
MVRLVRLVRLVGLVGLVGLDWLVLLVGWIFLVSNELVHNSKVVQILFFFFFLLASILEKKYLDQKLTKCVSFWPHKLNHNVSFWAQKYADPFTISEPWNWQFIGPEIVKKNISSNLSKPFNQPISQYFTHPFAFTRPHTKHIPILLTIPHLTLINPIWPHLTSFGPSW